MVANNNNNNSDDEIIMNDAGGGVASDGDAGSAGSSGSNENVDEKLINEEYKVWKKNAPYLYDMVVTHALDWPSLTVQWLPDKHEVPNQDYFIQRLLLGTHTSDNEPNHLMFAEVKMPKLESVVDMRDDIDAEVERSGFGAKVEIVQKINHRGEVNRARYCPQNPNIIATKTAQTDVLIFDRTKHPSKPSKDGVCTPDLKLRGHKKEGYGLAWSPHKEGYLVSGSDDKRVCLWDIGQGGGGKVALDAIHTWTNHEDVVEDVAWHYHSVNVLASCGDDRNVIFWDVRQANPSQTFQAHQKEINTIAFNPFNEFLFVTGSADRTAALWDVRNLKVKLHSFESHVEQIFNVAWAPFAETVFATCSADRRINIWDLSLIGQEQSTEDAEDGPPELLFVHGGHTDKISDFCWNPVQEWTIASVADNNVLQVWQMADSIYADDDDDMPADQLE